MVKRAPWKAPAGGGVDIIVAPAGLHQAILTDVIDRGFRLSRKYGTVARKAAFRYFLNSFDEETGKQHRIDEVLTYSTNKKAKLRARLESGLGRDFSEDEAADFDPQDLIGMNFQVLITHRTEGDRTYANIKNIMAAAKGAPKMEMPEGYEPEVVNYSTSESWPLVDPDTKRPLTEAEAKTLAALVEATPELRGTLESAIKTVVGFNASQSEVGEEDDDPFDDDDDVQPEDVI